MLKLFNTNLVGSSAKQVWSQAQSMDYGGNCQLTLVLTLICDDGESIVELAPIGSEIIQTLEQKCSKVESGEMLGKIVKNAISGLASGVVAHILVGQRENEKILIFGMGDVEVFLSRGGKLARLKNSWGEGESLSGTIAEKDILLFATSKLIKSIGSIKLTEILTQDKNPAEALAPLIHAKNDSSGIAGVVAIVGNEDISVSWPVISIADKAPRKLNMWIGGAILALLIVMIGLGMVKRVSLVRNREFEELNKSVSAKIQETLSIGDLNPERARTLLTQGKSEVDIYLESKITEEYRVQASKLLKDLENADDQAFKKNEIELNNVVELPILIDDLNASKMKSDGKGNLAFYDQNRHRIVTMNIADRSRQVIDYLEDKQYQDIAVSEGKMYGLENSGVFEIVTKKESVAKKIEADEFWIDPEYIGTFAGNVYIFDRGQSEIWKYPTLGDTYGDRRRWLAAGITPDLSNVIDMKVVGDIWLLTSTGKLERYSKGAPVKFGMDGFPGITEDKKLSDPSAMWVTENLIYVVERGASRILVFGDDGKYISQYVNSEFGKASDLVIVDDKGYVLIDNVVKEFGL